MSRLQTTVVLLVLVGSLVVVGLPGAAHDSSVTDASSSASPPEDELVQPRENASLLWPYTSAGRSVEDRTLAINVVVHGEPPQVKRSLTNRTGLEWNRTEANESDADAETHSIEVTDEGVTWNAARGAARYTYVDAGPRGGSAGWIAESYQLHAGTYLGTRHHVRAYESPHPDDDWTALQAHGEYWDWFRLRHTVTNVRGAAHTLEGDFIDEPYVSEVRREYHGNDKGYNDGWITTIELALAVLVGLSFTRTLPDSVGRIRDLAAVDIARNGQRILLVAAVLGLYLGVRTVGVALEQGLPTVTPKLFAGLLYPVIAVGIPVVAALSARPLDRTVAFGLAFAGLGAAFVLDFSVVGVDAIPIDLVLHRLGLLLSLGLIAAGSASRNDEPDRRIVALGAVGWVLSLLLPLFGVL